MLVVATGIPQSKYRAIRRGRPSTHLVQLGTRQMIELLEGIAIGLQRGPIPLQAPTEKTLAEHDAHNHALRVRQRALSDDHRLRPLFPTILPRAPSSGPSITN